MSSSKQLSAKISVKTELSRQAIVDAALAISDADGLDAVTIRAVALKFGVTPMALYWHVANKEELLDAMGDQLFAGLAQRVQSEGDWQDRLRVVMAQLLAALRAHPGSVSLAFPRILACEDGRLVTDYTLSILAELHLPADQSAFIACHVLELVVMTVSAESASMTGGAHNDAAHARKQQQLKSIPPDRYPHLFPVIDLLTGDRDPCRPTSYSDVGLEIFLAGIISVAAGVGTPTPTR